jgi:hypothetical protein
MPLRRLGARTAALREGFAKLSEQLASRTELLRNTICGWNLMRGGQPLPFNQQNLNEFLMLANPSIINMIEKDVRLANPWLLAEMTIEDIDKEIADLQDLRAKKVEEEAGKGTSNSR